MSHPAVHWHEGMFLRPQHFQTSMRYLQEQVCRHHKFDNHYSWGLRALDLDLDALANHRLVVHRLEARLRDGTTVQAPEDGPIKERDLREPMRRQTSLPVFLAVPALYLGRANAARRSDNGARPADARAADNSRYLIETQTCLDENKGANPQTIEMRRLNMKLLIGNEDQTGYEVVPLARIKKSERAEATPQLDEEFVPPLLSIDAWRSLHSGILQAIFERINQKVDFLAKQVANQGITFDRHAQGDARILQQLDRLNEAAAVLHVLLNAQGIHPLTAYLEFSRIVGQMAVLGAKYALPDLPRYDHDDLYACFARLKRHLDDILNIVVEPEYRERPFIGERLYMHAAIEPAWLEAAWQLYIGVRCSLERDAAVRLLTRPMSQGGGGGLDMKVGSRDHVEEIFRRALQGLRFELVKTPPRALPAGTDLILLQIKRDPQDAEWQQVQKSLSLGIRLNENLIASSINNQRVLTVRTDAKATTTLEFTLFAVPQDKV